MARAVEIRRATADDAAELARIAGLTFNEAFGHLYPAEDLAAYVGSALTAAQYEELLADRRTASWLLRAAGEPALGFAVAGYCKLPVKDLEPTAGELRQLYIRATHQNRRFGARLLETALRWLEEHYSPIYIGVWSKNEGAQRFYGRYGFVKIGEYGFPVGRTIDEEHILKRVVDGGRS
jgi:ribosomal protein S18 acetylase RimI-like enzyme